MKNNEEFYLLKDQLINNYSITDEVVKILDDKVKFDMEYNQIRAQQLLDQIEADLVNMGNKSQINENMIIESILLGLKQGIEKNKAKKKTKFPNNNVKTQSNVHVQIDFPENTHNYNTNSNNCEVKIETINSFNEKALVHTNNYNSKDISCTFFSNLEIKEYTLIPKDNYVKLDEYQKYFESFKNNFLKSLGIEPDNPLLDVDKFFLLVTFESTEGKPVLSDIVLIDPLKNYTSYLLKIENESYLYDHYFFCGQMIYIEGHLKNNEIFAQRIIFGIPSVSYDISESYVRGFFQEPAPYLIYAINGPIFKNKVKEDEESRLNMNLFLRTLNSIATENPHALILNGPLLNIDNDIIASGDFNLDNKTNYFDAFDYIVDMVAKIFADKRTTIILCPSLNDVTTFYSLPLPPYNVANFKNINNSDLARKGRLKLIGNPQLFQLNEIIFGVANFDVTKDMIANSIRPVHKVPLDSTLEMILQQRSFYPLLPNTVNDDIDKIDKTISIDERKIENLQMGAIPDIIITTSSQLPSFIKRSSSTLFINPGTLYKGVNPGTFVRISSYSPTSHTGTDVIHRLKVDLLKLSLK